MTVEEVYLKGYAIPRYDINNDVMTLIHNGDKYIVPSRDVTLIKLDGFPVKVVSVEEIMKVTNDKT